MKLTGCVRAWWCMVEMESRLTDVVVFTGGTWGAGESKSSRAVDAVCRADVCRHVQLRAAEGVKSLQHSQSRRATYLTRRRGQEATVAQGTIETRHAKSVRGGGIDILSSDPNAKQHPGSTSVCPLLEARCSTKAALSPMRSSLRWRPRRCVPAATSLGRR